MKEIQIVSIKERNHNFQVADENIGEVKELFEKFENYDICAEELISEVEDLSESCDDHDFIISVDSTYVEN